MVSKNEFKPNLFPLEGREQPGSILTTGLDASLLASVVLGDVVQAARPTMQTTQAPKQVDAVAVDAQPVSQKLHTPASVTFNNADAQSLEEIAGLTVAPPKTFTSIAEATGGQGSLIRPTGQKIPDPFFYGGDFNGVNGFTNEKGTLVADSKTWDDLRLRGAATVHHAFGHHLINTVGGTPLPLTANVEIRGPGVMGGSDKCLTGSVVISQASVPVTNTLISSGHFGTYGLYKVDADVSDFSLPGGHYYLNVQPNGVGIGQFFVATTSGTNGVGQPLGNDDTWAEYPSFGFPCNDTADVFGAGTWDVSYGVG
jgi:hypothetical protein